MTTELGKLLEAKKGAEALEVVSKISDAELAKLDRALLDNLGKYFAAASERVLTAPTDDAYDVSKRYEAQVIRISTTQLKLAGFKNPIHVGDGRFDVTESHDASTQIVAPNPLNEKGATDIKGNKPVTFKNKDGLECVDWTESHDLTSQIVCAAPKEKAVTQR